MGWLFAVALGMQDRDRGAVLRALPAIAIGHELSLVLVVAVVLGLGLLTDTSVLHLGAGIALVAFGIFRFVKPRAHFRWTTGRVNRRELAWWSFLMSSAHGAGLMVAPNSPSFFMPSTICAGHTSSCSSFAACGATSRSSQRSMAERISFSISSWRAGASASSRGSCARTRTPLPGAGCARRCGS
jgi:hypothetical protein